MELIKIYECLCDRTRLRILNLLLSGPLCVCHFQEVLSEPQVKISKHLSYLKTHNLVVANREANWMIYRLTKEPSRELRVNLACLQDCARENKIFQSDTAKLKKLRLKFEKDAPLCCPPKASVRKSKATTRSLA